MYIQVYFTVTIDGREVHSVENTDPRTFTNVRVFAGDKFKPAADASYRNFQAGHSFNIGSNVKRNKEIGTIDSWGPLFRVSLDLIIHSLDQDGWSSVLAFSRNGRSDHPAIYLHKNGFLRFHYTHVKHFDFPIELNHWYKIIIEQNGFKEGIKKKNQSKLQQ